MTSHQAGRFRQVSAFSRRSSARHARLRQASAFIEPIERRVLLTAITVTSLADTFADDGQVTLREAVQAANTDTAFHDAPAGSGADTIDFAPALFTSGTKTITLAGLEIIITGPLTITGPGANLLTIDAANTSRVFHADDGNGTTQSPVSISGVTLARGKVTGSGGAILSAEPLTLAGITVRDSLAAATVGDTTDAWPGGGGIATYRAPLTISDSTITNNQVTGLGFGGGINVAGDLTASNCTFTDNSSRDAGGGVGNGWGGTALLSNCTFSGNTSEKYGGGFYQNYRAGSVSMDHCTIINNSTGWFGGGVVLGIGPLTVTASNISNNTAGINGGGLQISSTSLTTISDSIISGNKVTTGGGHAGGGGISTNGPAIITRTSITGNSFKGAPSDLGGGGIRADGPLTLTDSTVSGNYVDVANGGGIAASDSVSISNTTISNNTAHQTLANTGGVGGGVFFEAAVGKPRVFNHVTIAGNIAYTSGGIDAGAGPITLRNTILAGNTAININPDMTGQADGDYNLVENTAGAFLLGSNNILGKDPMLKPLGNYGGPTQTQPPRPGSPAIDQAVSSNLAIDQTGNARPVQFSSAAIPSVDDAPGGDGSDIGAVEVAPPAPITDSGVTLSVAEGAQLNLSLPNPAPGGVDAVSYDWDFDYEGQNLGVSATGSSAIFSAAGVDGPATRIVAVGGRDASGNLLAITTITVNVTNAAPTATFAAGVPVTIGTASGVSFSNAKDASAADLAAGLKYSFDFNNDGDFDDVGDVLDSSSASASFIYPATGTFTVRGRVADKDGDSTIYTANVTVNPVPPISLRSPADAYVRDGTYAGTNYGTATELQVRKSSTAGNQRESYIRFDLSQVPSASTISSAKVRLFGKLSASGSVPVALYSVSNNTWTETGIKWSNKPAAGTTALSTKTVASTTGAWFEFDVTGYLKAQKQAGATAVNFALKATTATTPYATFSSDEASSNRPELRVQPVTPPAQAILLSTANMNVPEGGTATMTFSLAAQPTANVTVHVNFTGGDTNLYTVMNTFVFTPTNWNKPQSILFNDEEDADAINGTATWAFSATGLPTKTLTLTEVDNDAPASKSLRAIADSYVRDGTYATKNFGSLADLQVRKSTVTNNSRQTVLTFDISSIGSVSSATLKLFGKLDSTTNPSVTVQVFAASSTTWTESGVTWNNKPTPTGSALASATISGTTAKSYSFNLTSWLKSQKSAGKTKVSLILTSPTATTSVADFNSDEAGSNMPALVVS